MDNKEEFLRKIKETNDAIERNAITVVLLKVVVLITIVLLFAQAHRSQEPIPQNFGGTQPLEFGK